MITGAAQMDDAELLELVEQEVRELLATCAFPVSDTPIIIGSALKAMGGDTSAYGLPAAQKLIETLDAYIPEPVRPIDKPFMMPGDNVKLTAELISPSAMDDGLRFTIREGGRTVGAGVVTKILK